MNVMLLGIIYNFHSTLPKDTTFMFNYYKHLDSASHEIVEEAAQR